MTEQDSALALLHDIKELLWAVFTLIGGCALFFLGLLIHGVLLPKLLLLLGVVQIVSAIILAKGAYRRHADTRQTARFFRPEGVRQLCPFKSTNKTGWCGSPPMP